MPNANNGETFGNAIELFAGTLDKLPERLVDKCTDLAFRSITIGSAITGAPGQPVDTGALRASFTVQKIDRWTREISSPLIYAPLIEEGIGAYGPLTLRSPVGGFHSLKLTATGWHRIVALVATEEGFR